MSDQGFSVSVVVPVLNAENWIVSLLDAVFRQSHPVLEVVLVDSGSTDQTLQLASQYEKVRVVPIHNFSHGRSRNLGVTEAKGDVVALLTQDAEPAGTEWLSELVAPLEDEHVAATFARQIPREDAAPMEQFFLQTRFPPEASEKEWEDKTEAPSFQDEIFLSNVSSAMRREMLLEFPFDEELIMSEDQQFARDVITAGYSVVYQPGAVVIHSHTYTLMDIVRRYFDATYSLIKLFPDHDAGDSANLGIQYLKKEAVHMTRHHPLWLPYWIFYTGAKVVGTLLAHAGEKLPDWLLSRVSLHSYHWKDRRGVPGEG